MVAIILSSRPTTEHGPPRRSSELSADTANTCSSTAPQDSARTTSRGDRHHGGGELPGRRTGGGAAHPHGNSTEEMTGPGDRLQHLSLWPPCHVRCRRAASSHQAVVVKEVEPAALPLCSLPKRPTTSAVLIVISHHWRQLIGKCAEYGRWRILRQTRQPLGATLWPRTTNASADVTRIRAAFAQR